MIMNDLLRQIRNEWRANLWLGVELLVVFAVLWYLVDWSYVTLRTWLQPMGFDTEHCYNLSFNRLTPQADGYRADDDTEADMKHLLEIVERLRHRPGVEYVAVSRCSACRGWQCRRRTVVRCRPPVRIRWLLPCIVVAITSSSRTTSSPLSVPRAWAMPMPCPCWARIILTVVIQAMTICM